MAPAITADLQLPASSSKEKPTVYVLDKFHPDAIEHARGLFNVVLNIDPDFDSWHQAEYLLIRASWLRAADIAACSNLKAIGKHGRVPYRRASALEDVVAAADVLTLHVPLTADTRDLLSYEVLCTTKPEVILINAARGGIVNERDLERVLHEGRVWGAGLDCHEQEPPMRERYGALWELPNVVSTPHIGAATAEAQRTSALAAVDNLHRYIIGSQK